MPATPLPPKVSELHSPLTTLAAKEIRERIVSGRLQPGARLVEGKLSEEMGISRMPVREALRVLAAEGLVSIEPRRGATVSEYTPEQVRDMVEVRATLEGLNARLAARRHDRGEIAKLKHILESGSKLTSKDDLLSLERHNALFHDALAHSAANTVLQEILTSLRERTALLFTMGNRERIRETWKEHAQILLAVISGDEEKAALLATRHVYLSAGLDEDGGPVAKPPAH
jgi:DNA-binding GntR family transcriptional regulator